MFGGIYSRGTSTSVVVYGTAACSRVLSVHYWFDRIANKGHFDRKLWTHLFLYSWILIFVCYITESVLDEFERLLEDPGYIVPLLSTTVPDQATFMMKNVLINSFLSSALGLLNVGSLIVRSLVMM